MRTPHLAFVLALLCGSLSLPAQPPAAIATDPAPDTSNPPTLQTFTIPSHGSALNAILYVAAGPGPHGTVLMLHGFPGNEKNLDLAQAVRRAGWNALYFDYRGSWGTPGTFSFAHSFEDAESALVFLRDPGNAARLQVDPARLVLVGHSMGGMIAVYTAAHDPRLLGLAVFSASDMAGRAQLPPGSTPEARRQMLAGYASGLSKDNNLAPLSGCTAEGLAAELMAHPEWSLLQSATSLSSLPVLIITSDDGLAEPAARLYAAIETAGSQTMQYVHISSDHSYSGKRIELTEAILAGLDYLKGK